MSPMAILRYDIVMAQDDPGLRVKINFTESLQSQELSLYSPKLRLGCIEKQRRK